jgi:nucleoside-diphosphate-sugar epimerase
VRVLILGGTRNLGPGLVAALLERGHRVSVCNRGVTPDDLPAGVERLRADRRDRRELERALAGRRFDGVVDTTLYDGAEAAAVADLLAGRTGHYVALSSGQVYLVRLSLAADGRPLPGGLPRPFVEEDFDGPVMPAPPPGSRDHEEWAYGVGKRAAEEALAAAVRERRFPATLLRLPMVHGERDHYHRLHGYLARIADGGPILLPAGPHLAIRHVDGADVVRAVVALLESGAGRGRAYNLAPEETLSIEEFLELLARLAGRPPGAPPIVRPARARLLEAGLLPACSPFSNPWMSELDNRRSKRELGFVYTPFAATLERLVRHFERLPPPPGYAQRERELALAARASS